MALRLMAGKFAWTSPSQNELTRPHPAFILESPREYYATGGAKLISSVIN